VLEVRNSGSHIPLDEQGRVFDRLFRCASAGENGIAGVGLGLTICKAIVDGHGGTITVESKEQTGTTFKVALPLEPAPGEAGVDELVGRRAA
jgi:K+-sensing histidine kinase KdpD